MEGLKKAKPKKIRIGRKELIDIKLKVFDEKGNEKEFVTIEDVFSAVVEAYQIDFDGVDDNNYRDNLYKIVKRALIGDKKEKKEDKLKKGNIVRDGKKYKIAVGYARSVLCSDKFIKSIYKFSLFGNAKAKTPEKLHSLERLTEEKT